jgi:hypothetical protein
MSEYLDDVFRRKWINQPSVFQPLHHLNGMNVLAVRENDTTSRIYFLQGDIVSMQCSPMLLVDGWRSQ